MSALGFSKRRRGDNPSISITPPYKTIATDMIDEYHDFKVGSFVAKGGTRSSHAGHKNDYVSSTSNVSSFVIPLRESDSFTNKTLSKNLFVLLAKTKIRRDILIFC